MAHELAQPWTGRTNIDDALTLERIDYAGVLDPEALTAAEVYGKHVIRSPSCAACDPIYADGHMAGFEFTHHDPMQREEHRASFLRKIERLRQARGREDVVFLYHHREARTPSLGAIRSKLRAFAGVYSGPGARCTVAWFRQAIATTDHERRLDTEDHGGGLLEYVVHTRQAWGGHDADVFRARVDDDLRRDMIDHIDRTAGRAPAG